MEARDRIIGLNRCNVQLPRLAIEIHSPRQSLAPLLKRRDRGRWIERRGGLHLPRLDLLLHHFAAFVRIVDPPLLRVAACGGALAAATRVRETMAAIRVRSVP